MRRIKTEEKYMYSAILLAVVLITLKLTLLPVIPWWVATMTLWLPFAFVLTMGICLVVFVILSMFAPKSKTENEGHDIEPES